MGLDERLSSGSHSPAVSRNNVFKRKWDQEAPDGDASAPAAKAVKHEDNKIR